MFPVTLLEYVEIYVEHIVLQIGNWVIRLFLQLSVFSGCFSLFSPVFRLFSHLLSKRRTRLQILWLAHGSKIADEDLVLIGSDDIDIDCLGNDDIDIDDIDPIHGDFTLIFN